MTDTARKIVAIQKHREKNEARRRCRERNRDDYANGRTTRRLMAHNGAFGRLPAVLYNLCAVGTTALPRQPKIRGKKDPSGAE